MNSVKKNIGIYCGKGASHSWLWCVDMMEKFGCYNLKFLDENNIRYENGLKDVEVLMVSGGDTFLLAKSIKSLGANTLESFVKKGGIYIGSCAGAYLVMHSSKKHLKEFNFVKIKISNLTKNLPAPKKMKHKYFCRYGCRYVFHPIRGEIQVKLDNGKKIVAPLYGGPSMSFEPQDKIKALGFYDNFTPNTQFLSDENIAKDTILGKVAVVKSSLGDGYFYLFGPHFEHPSFAEANKYLYQIVAQNNKKKSRFNDQRWEKINKRTSLKMIRDIKRELSNFRIVAYSMEHIPIFWKIEEKVYEPQKIIVFVESMWKRIKYLEKYDELKIKGREVDSLSYLLSQNTKLIRQLKKEVLAKVESTTTAQKLFETLLKSSKLFFSIYFLNKKEKICITQ